MRYGFRSPQWSIGHACRVRLETARHPQFVLLQAARGHHPVTTGIGTMTGFRTTVLSCAAGVDVPPAVGVAWDVRAHLERQCVWPEWYESECSGARQAA